MNWKEFNREAQLHGLATTGGVIGTTGVAGLTLGGGIGWLMAKYGLALDNLLAVNLVLADGSIVRASSPTSPRPLLGGARRRRKFRRGGFVRIPPASGRANRYRRSGGISLRRSPASPARFS